MTLVARRASSLHSAGASFAFGLSSFSSLQPLAWLYQLHQTRSSSLLSYEEVSAGSPTPNHQTARPSRTLFVLHGLLGCGRNWRTWSRRLVEAAAASHPPEGGPWRALLVDLRCHGASTLRPGLHPPNNMLSAAEDVSRLVRHVLGSHQPGAVLGHSMGGKVALALLQQAAQQQEQHRSLPPPQQQQRHRPRTTESLSAAAAAAAVTVGPSAAAAAAAGQWCAAPRQLWVLDSQPGLVTAEQDGGTGISRVLSTVHSVPLPIPSRAWLLLHLGERGLSDALAAWLASGLVPVRGAQPPSQQPSPSATASSAAVGHDSAAQHDHHHHLGHHRRQQQRPQQHGGGTTSGGRGDGPFVWSFDIQCAGSMYMSYRTTEYWKLLESPPHGTAVHLVQGARSDRWPEVMQRRLNQAAAAAVARVGTGSFEHHVLERAGHWLHVDDPEGLLQLVLPRLAGL